MVEKLEIGGVLVTSMQVNTAIAKLEAVGGTAIAQPLRAIDSPLATCEYHEVAKATRTAFPSLVRAAGTKQKHTAHEKTAFIFALKVHAGHADGLPGGANHGGPFRSGPGHDLIAGRRTAKKNYGEDEATEWARKTFPGALQVEKVGDQVPKLGYDVKVILADGKQVHIEAKATAGDGRLVALEGASAYTTRVPHARISAFCTWCMVSTRPRSMASGTASAATKPCTGTGRSRRPTSSPSRRGFIECLQLLRSRLST